MVRGFWDTLAKPFLALAPMSGVTDAAFRHIVCARAKPDVCFTEFVSAAGLCSAGRERLLPLLRYSEGERPIVAQVFGSRPDDVERTAALVCELGFDGIDINAGCPDRSVEKQGAGAALIKTPELARDLILAAKRGAGSLPVSIKTRLGYTETAVKEFLPVVLEAAPAVLTMHFRTRKQLYRGAADWRQAELVCELVADSGCGALVVGNGDVAGVSQARERARATGVDGVMIGRAVMGNPWLFGGDEQVAAVSLRHRLETMLEHSRLYCETEADGERCAEIKKHYKAYVAGFPGAKELRARLMAVQTFAEAHAVIGDYLDGIGFD